MAVTQLLTVEFRGGPFDGHLQVVGLSVHELSSFVTLPVNPETIAALTHKLHVAQSAPTSIAVYELAKRSPMPQYEFLGAVDPTETVFLKRP
jgi:hypothetical protein